MDWSQPLEAEWGGEALRKIRFQGDPLVESLFEWKSHGHDQSGRIIRLLVCCSGPGSVAMSQPFQGLGIGLAGKCGPAETGTGTWRWGDARPCYLAARITCRGPAGARELGRDAGASSGPGGRATHALTPWNTAFAPKGPAVVRARQARPRGSGLPRARRSRPGPGCIEWTRTPGVTRAGGGSGRHRAQSDCARAQKLTEWSPVAPSRRADIRVGLGQPGPSVGGIRSACPAPPQPSRATRRAAGGITGPGRLRGGVAPALRVSAHGRDLTRRPAA